MSGETVADRRVHPGTILLRFIKEMPSTVVALPAALSFMSDKGLTRFLYYAAAIGVVVIFFNWLAWSRYRYGVGEREIVIEKGILNRTRRSIPFDRIQDVDIERSLLARIFGLAKVRVETGAGGKDEGVLDSVTVAEAARLREAVRAWRLGEAPAFEAAAEGEAAAPAPAGRTLFQMGPPRVLLFGLFNFSLVYLAGLFAFLQTFDNLLPFDIYDPARWVGLAGDYLPQRFSLGAIAAVLFLAVILGVVAGVLRTLSRDFGFRLSLEGGRFRRERGLFTRTEAVIARRRVQLAQVQTGPIRRAFGWSGLSFQTLGAGTDASGHQSAAPFATRPEIERVLAETKRFRLPPPPELAMVSRRHIARAVGPVLLPPLAVVIALAVQWPQALVLLAALPLFAILAVLERRFHRYGLDGELLFVQRGLWRQRLWAVPVGNVQAMSLSRSWLQRRLGLASLSLDTAGAPALNFPRIVDVRDDVARALADEISARRRAAQASGRKSGTDR
jgi:putative membrane protein